MKYCNDTFLITSVVRPHRRMSCQLHEGTHSPTGTPATRVHLQFPPKASRPHQRHARVLDERLQLLRRRRRRRRKTPPRRHRTKRSKLKYPPDIPKQLRNPTPIITYKNSCQTKKQTPTRARFIFTKLFRTSQ